MCSVQLKRRSGTPSAPKGLTNSVHISIYLSISASIYIYPSRTVTITIYLYLYPYLSIPRLLLKRTLRPALSAESVVLPLCHLLRQVYLYTVHPSQSIYIFICIYLSTAYS